MIDYYKSFPHLHPEYVPPEIVEEEKVADSLLNVDGKTTHDLENESKSEEVVTSLVLFSLLLTFVSTNQEIF